MQYIRANRVDGDVIYSVYNSLGQCMLYTRHREYAEQIAASFRRNPDCRIVIVGSKKPKR